MDPFDYIPLTFHIKNGINDPEWKKFLIYYNTRKSKKKCKNFWIIKPGEFSNRGQGIVVESKLEDI